MKRTLIALFASLILASSHASANTAKSAYTKINFDNKSCVRVDTPPPAGEPDIGSYHRCPGYQDYFVWFSHGDLRESVHFSKTDPDTMSPKAPWESFASFNAVNTTVEWRLKNGKPVAAIYRHFITRPDGSRDDQYLMVKSIADARNGTIGCIQAAVDARAVKNANKVATALADGLQFSNANCAKDAPTLYAEKATAPFFEAVGTLTKLNRAQ